jgi:transcription initiation factor TFIIIB Brf1 subunit/transcription initiation factor TFIIB
MACVYLAAEQMGPLVTQAAVAEAAGISEPTLRARYMKLQADME